MAHKPIQIQDMDLSFPHKVCFQNFSCKIHFGSRIAIIGRNGSGKSTLLKIIENSCDKGTVVGYVPQIIEENLHLSGGERLNKAITQAISKNPDVLLLDEPTNHLDLHNRKSLMRLLQVYSGTLVVVSHDKELLRNCTETLWHIDHGKIHIFSGNYDDYIQQVKIERASIENELEHLNRQKKEMHHKLMQEQQRAAKSKAKGEKKVQNRKWLKMVGDLKGMKAEKSQGKKIKNIDTITVDLSNRLADLHLPEKIVPQFSIENCETNSRRIVQISNGSIGYAENKPLLTKLNFNLEIGKRIAIIGRNGSGKSTLLKAILGDKSIYRTGDWYVIKQEDIGYLDQHYTTLDPNKTVFETISGISRHESYGEIRRYLNDFLFRKNEEANNKVSLLSGGEKARLCLAQIAAKQPKLLIIDEITNNLDLETQDHVIQVLRAYTGAMIVVSHDADFLKEIFVNESIEVGDFMNF